MHHRHLIYHAIVQGYVAIAHAREHAREFCAFNPLARSPVALKPAQRLAEMKQEALAA